MTSFIFWEDYRGGFGGNGGSIITTGSTGGAGGGGFGGNGGDVTLAFDLQGGGGGGGGGIGSRATIGLPMNLGNGGTDQNVGLDGNGYGLTITAGSGGGGHSGGNNAGGGGGGGPIGGSLEFGGGGGGSLGDNGRIAKGNTPPSSLRRLRSARSSGGTGGDGAGGGGGGIVITAVTNQVDGQAGAGGYGGGGGGGGGPSNGDTASGGSDTGNLGGGVGGDGANTYGAGFGGGGGGGGSGLGAAIFVDTGLDFTIQAFSGVPTTFNTPNNTTQEGTHGIGGPGGSDGTDGIALGNSIFLRTGSSLILMAEDAGDVLTLGDQVAFSDDTNFGRGGTHVFVMGNGTVIYPGTTDYQGTITVNNANFIVNGLIDETPLRVCRDSNFSSQRGTLSGRGTLTGTILVNSGTISPDVGATLTLGELNLTSAAAGHLGSLVHINIDSGGTSLVAVTGAASLAGILEINLDSTAQPGQYTLLTSAGITGTFDSISFTGITPNYTISYLPVGAPTYVQFNFLGPSLPVNIPATLNGSPILNPAVVCCGRPVLLGPLPVAGSGPTIYTVTNKTGNIMCEIGHTQSQTYLKMYGKNGSCTIMGTKNGIVSSPLTVIAP